jgi:uncharacterized membrane protein
MSSLEGYIHIAMRSLEVAGAGIIFFGAIYSSVIASVHLLKKEKDAYLNLRRRLSRAILMGLEFLVAADIIRTVVIELTFSSIGVLSILIIIRTFLSFTLEVEMTGKWPWQENNGSPVEH